MLLRCEAWIMVHATNLCFLYGLVNMLKRVIYGVLNMAVMRLYNGFCVMLLMVDV